MTSSDMTRNAVRPYPARTDDGPRTVSRRRRPPRWLTTGQGALSFPTAPLRAIIDEVGTVAGISPSDVALRLGISRRQLRRVMRQETIGWQLADALAIAVGRHPSALWPQWFAQFPM